MQKVIPTFCSTLLFWSLFGLLLPISNAFAASFSYCGPSGVLGESCFQIYNYRDNIPPMIAN